MNLAFLSKESARFLFRIFYYFLPYVQYQPEVTNNFDQSYDYIIAGAGSAGSVVASRLSEDPCVRVLLLEAGPKTDVISEIPGAARLNQNTKNDWAFPSTTQKRGLDYYPNDLHTSVGKGLGGSSMLNYMLYVRGNKRDYDRWADNGCTGWAWDDVLPYFLKAENNTDPEIRENGLHSKSGPLTVSTIQDNNPVIQAFADAGPEMGYEHLDINGPKQTGFAKMQGTIRNGRRCSTAKAYLVPAQDRDNLDIVREAYVEKILINKNKEAYGVRFAKDGMVYDINADKEVIVSLGAFNTPKTLMLSGIGRKDHLQEFGIDVIADLPVGDNLQNHLANLALKFSTNQSSPLLPEIDLIKAAQRYKKNATGKFATLANIQGFSFTNSKHTDPKLDWPDLETMLIPDLPKIFAPDAEISDKDSKKDGKPNVVFYVNYLRPKSRGTVRLKSTNPYDYPLIDYNLLDSRTDLDGIVDSMRFNVKMVQNTQAFQKIGAKMATNKLSGCEQHDIYSDDYLRCAAQKYPGTAHHPTCSCKMGDPDDKTTVVDPQLKVKGVKNLRIVDGSVMPQIVSGNTNAPIIMIGEKASDMIKMDNPDRQNCS